MNSKAKYFQTAVDTMLYTEAYVSLPFIYPMSWCYDM
jgi:hypothetical protein